MQMLSNKSSWRINTALSFCLLSIFSFSNPLFAEQEKKAAAAETQPAAAETQPAATETTKTDTDSGTLSKNEASSVVINHKLPQKINHHDGQIRDAIVKIYTVANYPSYFEPWNSSTEQFSGSGSIIAGNKILTNAHVVADSTFIEVRRYGKTKRYEAEVISVSHDADLALLRVKNEKFFEDTQPLPIGVLPEMQQDVTVYGFPMGGDNLSITQGVVSRIEYQSYAHSSEDLLSVQIDAAINSGNSGGPVISSGKIVGVVMQKQVGADNIGYMVPTPVINHFFDDIKDGEYHGFPALGLETQTMENPGLKKKYDLNDEQSGLLVYYVHDNSSAQGKIKPGDIISHISNHRIADDGTVEFRPKEYTSFSYFIDLHQLGDSLTLNIIRDSKPLQVELKLDKAHKAFRLIQLEEYDKFPRYFIFGGIMFTPLTQNYILSGWSTELMSQYYQWPTEERTEVVIASQVLPADLNKGYHHLSDWVIDKVNGETFKDFDEFYALVMKSQDDFVSLEDEDGYQIIIDRQKANETHKALLAQYHISADRSKDLMKQ